MAFSFVPMQAATYANITAADTGRASAIYSTQRQVAAALGVATLATVWQTTTRSEGTLGGYHVGFAAGIGIVVVGAVLAYVLIRDGDAASTMRRRVDGGADETASPVPAAVP